MQKADNFRTDHIWCVVPVFNNKETVKNVALQCRRLLQHIVVVDDGSTDTDVSALFLGSDITVLKHQKNQGKGKAILTALQYIKSQGGHFMITIDADGQHYPRDIEKFIPLLEDNYTSVLVGCRKFNSENIPGKSRFGRKLANFWLRIETGLSIDDCQSGFRCYPVEYISRIALSGFGYDFETEVLARAAWAGLGLKAISVDVWYPQPQKRISNFRPVVDNFRISCMHARLVGRRLLPWPCHRLIPDTKDYFKPNILRHPIKALKALLKENATPAGLAVSAGVGIFLAVLPLLSVHTLVIIYVTTRLHLNKVMAVSIQNLCMPPFVPVVCIEIGHFMRYGRWLTDVSLRVVFGQLPDRVFEWLLGSLIVAPIMAVTVGIIVFYSARSLQKRSVDYASS
ncbi:MAG: DUF2062 domain-containing protein [Candidatus Omnitrophica bacterium]|nr:DUF2062 domain-containing protein [Candidatus Omnitrophota bacterium]